MLVLETKMSLLLLLVPSWTHKINVKLKKMQLDLPMNLLWRIILRI